MYFLHVRFFFLIEEPFFVVHLLAEDLRLIVEHNGCATLILAGVGSLLVLGAPTNARVEVRHP